MYLKRLESVGFKSFAERINVEFVPGVTAIVGPNGSGKSNITDALRWVLGEQSAKSLRGSKMEDIIFQGSDSRKALNVAEVTIVLDNSEKQLPLDYEEVSVTRRVYRSGDSEFYLNKQSCRLKDIVDLFMDSGLGREAFSIISQGKVEEILSSKAEERRVIFEEAAGVLKYKQRKKKAEYKLAETQENLNRVEDIIHELEQQLTPLKEQADRAKEYLRQKEALKEQEISLLITEIEQLYGKWQALLDELEQNKFNEIELKTTIQQKEAELEEEQQAIQKLDTSIEKLQEKLLDATKQLEHLEGKKQLLNERTKNYADNKQKLEQRVHDLENRIDKTADELETEKKKLVSLQETRLNTKNHVEVLRKKLATNQEDIAEQIEGLKAEYIEFLNKQAAMRNEKQTIQQQLSQITAKKDVQSSKFQDFLQLRDELLKKSKQTEKQAKVEEERYIAKESKIKHLKSELSQTRSAHQESQTKLYKGYQYLENLKSKKEMLEEMKEDFQGFFQGVKAILKARKLNKLNEIHGAIIELIDVPKQFIQAIETVLGGQAQNIVVTDDQAARKAISWLKQTNNGRATFLPLASIQSRFITPELLAKAEKHPGFIGVAANLVKTKQVYQKAVDYLMGHVIIAENLRAANEIAKLIMGRFRIVTIEGDVVNPGGSMTGGAQKKTNQSLFTREKDLAEITEKLHGYQKKVEQFERHVAKQEKQITDKENELEQLEQLYTTDQYKLQEAKQKAKEIELKLATLNNNLAVYDQDRQQFDQDSNELIARDQQLTVDLTKIESELNNLQQQIEILNARESEFKESREQLQHDLHQYQIALAEQEERVRNQRENTNARQLQLTELKESHKLVTNELSDLIEAHQSEEATQKLDEQIESYKINKQTLTESIQSERSNRLQRTERLKDEERELKEENVKHQQLMEKIQHIEVRVNRLDVELENRLSQLQTDYTITYEKAMQSYEKVADIVEANKIVETMKQNISELGTVNIGAIDEYERISERFAFLSEQRNDLTTAKETLYTVIAEMDAEMESLFSNTFAQIKTEFSTVFKELFGGGHAELNLTDPKDLLHTGVEIIAQPPGKRLQHLGLLSGGERALTAIALLFAILRVRPVPFCVLDEVEAALDEANVVRYAKYIKMYSEQTQFIVITHRKGTMEEADVLYGVTMQESGVSRLVSVRLEETKDLIKS